MENPSWVSVASFILVNIIKIIIPYHIDPNHLCDDHDEDLDHNGQIYYQR